MVARATTMSTCLGPCYHHHEMTTTTTPCHHHHCTSTSMMTPTQGWHYLCHRNNDDDDDDTPPSCPYVNDDDKTCPGHTTIAAQRPHPRSQRATSHKNNNECVQCDNATSRNDDNEHVQRDDVPSPSLLPSPSVSSSQATLRDDNDALSPSLPSPCPHSYSYPCIPCILLVTNIYLFLLLPK